MRTIFSNNQNLIIDKKNTFLTSQQASGTATLTVESIVGFAVNQILLIEDLGNEKSEIILTHGSTSPTGFTITLASNLSFAHDQGTKVYILDWNQVEFYHATTETGSKTLLTTVAIQPDQLETQYTDSSYSSGYYFVRFKNTITTTYSDYSDPIPWGGYGQNTVGFAIKSALERNKLKGFTDNVTHDFCVQEINDCLNIIRGELKKWHNLQSFDYVLGQTARGVYKYALPATMWQYSNMSVLNLRVEGYPSLTYLTKDQFNEEMEDIVHGILDGNVTTGATSIILESSAGFPDSGTIMIKGQSITFTTNTRTTNTLSGIPASGTGSITSNLTDGDDVWFGNEEGIPEEYTIVDGYALVWPLPNSTNLNKNILLDFWKEMPSVDSDNDEIDLGRYDMVKIYLTWAIRSQLSNDGLRDIKDADYLLFTSRLRQAVIKELRTFGQQKRLNPNINQIKF